MSHRAWISSSWYAEIERAEVVDVHQCHFEKGAMVDEGIDQEAARKRFGLPSQAGQSHPEPEKSEAEETGNIAITLSPEEAPAPGSDTSRSRDSRREPTR